MKERIRAYDVFRIAGKLHSVRGVLTAQLPAAVGELCLIGQTDHRQMLAEVVGIDGGVTQLLPYHEVGGLQADATVIRLQRGLDIPFSKRLLGRVLDGIGNPVDAKGELRGCRRIEPSQSHVS